MPAQSRSLHRLAAAALLAGAGALHAPPAASDTKHLAPGFTARPAQSRLAIVPPDMELFSISAGGVQEPRADWTDAAQRHVRAALAARRDRLGPDTVEVREQALDAMAELLALQRAVAKAVFEHHTGLGMRLPTKDGRLDWSLGEAVRPLREATGADYALFTWVRDSYASGERKATMLVMALLGAVTTGGEQTAHASLVDLRTGRIVWFNDVRRMGGDLREPASADETIETLLTGFPALR